MSRTIFIAGNWKMHLSETQCAELAREVSGGFTRSDVEVMLAPHFLAMRAVADAVAGTPVSVGAQDLYWQDQGAFTGEVSGPMLAGMGVKYAIIGHSERRQYFGETEKTVNLKLGAALKSGLLPVVCVGETLAEREAELTAGVLESQLAGGLAGLSASQAQGLVLAYEPVWAIGTGKTASVAQAAEAHALIRSWLAGRFDKQVAEKIRILYGGSVKPANAAELLAEADVDGALVGGAALKAADFLAIIEAA